MKILALECSAGPASAAITENGKLLAEFYCNIGLKHSQTLMPMVEASLNACGISTDEIDGFCISNGPGSFTGIRIGISALKGMTVASEKPCVGVSTLLSMAYSKKDFNGLIVSVMDARCDQFYFALFSAENGKINRILPDSALSKAEVCDIIKSNKTKFAKDVIIVGDGADLLFGSLSDTSGIFLADGMTRYQSARFVAEAAEELFISGETLTASELQPVYLRLPQAERELKKRSEKI